MFKMRSRNAATPPAPLSVSGTMLSHLGCVREINEDVVAFVLPDDGTLGGDFGMLALVADGMGGHAAGEVASRIAADTVLRLYYASEGSAPAVLAACLKAANQAIRAHAQAEAACAGMGTTCTVLALRDGAAFLAHIGDSRAYLLRDGRLQQISEDHSLVAELVRDGALTADEAARSPQRHVILRALGTEPSPLPSIWDQGLPLRAADVFILCSDGLSDLIDDQTIAETAARLPPRPACEALIDAALAAGGTDNVSVGIFALGADPPRSAEALSTRPLPVPGNGEP